MINERYTLAYEYNQVNNTEHIYLVDTIDNSIIVKTVLNSLETPIIVTLHSSWEILDRVIMKRLRNEFERENDIYTETIYQYCFKNKTMNYKKDSTNE